MDDLIREAELARKRLSLSHSKAEESLASLRAKLVDGDVDIATVGELADRAVQLVKDLHKRDHAALSKVGKASVAVASGSSGGGDSSVNQNLSPSLLEVSPRIVDAAPGRASKEGAWDAACGIL